MGSHLFGIAPMVVARVATLPARRAEITRVELVPDAPDYSDKLSGYLHSLIDDPLLCEAIEVSSSALSSMLDKARAGQRIAPAKLERAAFATTRYLLRMCTRPTPFGLLAGVATGMFATHARVRMGGKHTRSARVDAGWLSAVVGELERRPEVRRGLRVTANDLSVLRGDRLVLTFLHGTDRQTTQPASGVSVRYTAVVAAVVAAARRPVGYRQLCDTLLTAFPAATEEAVDGLLAQLIEKQFLLTDLRPHPTDADPIERITGVAGDTDTAHALLRARDSIEVYRSSPFGAGRENFRSAARILRELQGTNRPPLHVDLANDLEFRLPTVVAKEIERTAGALYRMSRRSSSGAMVEYHADFLERYGTDQIVPILELLDPNLGLDAPAGYRSPQSSRDFKRPHPGPQDLERADVVAELTWAARDGGELILDEQAVDRLGGGSIPRLPTAVEMCVQVFSASLEALDRGEFTVALSPIGGFTRPGTMAGRFMRMLGAESALIEMLSGDRGGLPVQVFCNPATARSANMSSIAQVVRNGLPIGIFTDRQDSSMIDIADVAVGADMESLYLVSERFGQVLHPAVPHMLNPRYELPNVVRLLLDIEQSGPEPNPGQWWDWGRLDKLPSLPRVRYGRTILIPARWRPDPELCTSKETWSCWCDRLAAWRDRWRVPAAVEVTIRDHRVELDLDVSLHRQLLRQELCRGAGVVLSESLAIPRSGLDWLDGHAAEFVVQLNRAPSAAAARPGPIVTAPMRSQTRYEPGGEWLYAKLYAAEPTHDDLLTYELPALLGGLPDGVDRWFFVRYRDPEPHLRIRFHGDPDVINGDLLPRLRAWASRTRDRRALRRIALDTYAPELNRYGGPGVMAAAEELFCADSATVIDQLQRHAGELRQLPIEVLAAMNIVELLRSLGDWDWMNWVVQGISLPPATGIDRAFKSLVDPVGLWDQLAALPGGRDLVTSWAQRQRSTAEFGRRLLGAAEPADRFQSIVRSVLHMHANRLMGVHKAQESQALSIVRERAHSFLVRSTGTLNPASSMSTP